MGEREEEEGRGGLGRVCVRNERPMACDGIGGEWIDALLEAACYHGHVLRATIH